MKKRVISLVLALALLILTLPGAALAGSLSNFAKVNAYTDGQFADVPSGAWYEGTVRLAYEMGLVSGKTASAFEPDSSLTLAEAIKLAACLHSIYNTGSVSLTNGDPWYRPYVDYALANGIITSEYPSYDTPALRSDFASIFSRSLPEEALTRINAIEDGSVPDVSSAYSYGSAVYLLYRAGILTGSDEKGTFYPNSNIKRSEVAAIVTRMADVSQRKSFTLSAPVTPPNTQLSATQISAKCSPAVFYIEALSTAGNAYKNGSGFFIDSSGIAVTNYHVIKGASGATITMTDGSKYTVAGIVDYNESTDLALLKIDGGPFPYLELGDSSALQSGESVYTISSPLGLQNTITSGIISNTARALTGGEVSYIQIDASISPGSSGGALINTEGKVIGVTAANVIGGQNLNLAVPINLVGALKKTGTAPLKSILPPVTFYSKYGSVPDYGAYSGAPLYKSRTDDGAASYVYKAADIDMTYDEAFYDYGTLLAQNGFLFLEEYVDSNGFSVLIFENSEYAVAFGPLEADGLLCMIVIVMW